MGSPNSLKRPLNFRIHDLFGSIHPEDRELVPECEKLLKAIVEKIKPVLRYIVTPYGAHRALKVLDRCRDDESRALFLNLQGQFLIARIMPDGTLNEPAYQVNNPQLLYRQILDEVIGGLERAFADAEKKREEHLETLRVRHGALTAMMVIANGGGNFS